MADERKGVLTPKQEDLLAEALDFWFKFKNPLLEGADRFVFKNIIRAADDIGADKIPQAWKNDLIPIIDAAMEGRKEDVRTYAVDLLNKRIDIKLLDEEQELVVFDTFSRFAATAIDFYMQKRAA